MNLKFIENHQKELLDIIVKERKRRGIGVLFIDLSNNEKADVKYMAVLEPDFPEEIKQKIEERFKLGNSNSDKCFICAFDNNNNQFIEVDIPE